MNPSVKSTEPNGRLFVDANVLLEIVLSRAKERSARDFLQSTQGQLYISTLTGHLVTHFGVERAGLTVLRQFLSDYTMLSLEQSDFEWAFLNARDKDFEDALQLAVAIRHGCDEFVTFDQLLAKTYGSLPLLKIILLR